MSGTWARTWGYRRKPAGAKQKTKVWGRHGIGKKTRVETCGPVNFPLLLRFWFDPFKPFWLPSLFGCQPNTHAPPTTPNSCLCMDAFKVKKEHTRACSKMLWFQLFSLSLGWWERSCDPAASAVGSWWIRHCWFWHISVNSFVRYEVV